MRLGDIFEKYEVKEIPEDYADYKYYYQDGMFKLNVVYYHNETKHHFAELDKINEEIRKQNEELSKQLEIQAQAIMELAEIIGGE